MRLSDLCLIFALLAPTNSRATEVMWVTTSSAVMQQRETLDSGLLTFLTAHLPAFHHQIVGVSPARAYHELEHGAGICKADVIVTPQREGLFAFSARRRVMSGFKLMIRKDELPGLGSALTAIGEVDLDRLAAIQGLSGGVTSSRRYDPVIEAFIQRRGGDHIDTVVATFQLFNLVEASRLDFAFVLPIDFYFYQSGEAHNSLALLPLKGVAPTLAAGIACSRDPTGLAVIAAIDALLADERHWAEFAEPFHRWLPEADYAQLLHGTPPGREP